jgi:uncharacterized protein with von Willebrand factor type A (vWA) domain
MPSIENVIGGAAQVCEKIFDGYVATTEFFARHPRTGAVVTLGALGSLLAGTFIEGHGHAAFVDNLAITVGSFALVPTLDGLGQAADVVSPWIHRPDAQPPQE